MAGHFFAADVAFVSKRHIHHFLHDLCVGHGPIGEDLVVGCELVSFNAVLVGRV